MAMLHPTMAVRSGDSDGGPDEADEIFLAKKLVGLVPTPGIVREQLPLTMMTLVPISLSISNDPYTYSINSPA